MPSPTDLLTRAREVVTRQPTLFAMPTKPRRVLLRVVDAGDHGCKTRFRYFVRLECPKCGHDAGWSEHMTKKASMSQPCPKCNGEAIQTGGEADSAGEVGNG